MDSPWVLSGGRVRRLTPWARAVKMGAVKRDSKGRILPRSGKRKKTRRYRGGDIFGGSYFDKFMSKDLDEYEPSDLKSEIIPASSISQGKVDEAALQLGLLKRKWDDQKAWMDDDTDSPPPAMYTIAGKIAKLLAFLNRAEKLDYIPSYPLPKWSTKDKSLVQKMVNIERATKKYGGDEFERLIARSLAKRGEKEVSRKEIRKRIMDAIRDAKRKLSELDDPYDSYSKLKFDVEGAPLWGNEDEDDIAAAAPQAQPPPQRGGSPVLGAE